MLKQSRLATVWALIALMVPLSRAQNEADHAPGTSAGNPDAKPAKISEMVLASHGFSFADQPRPMCKVNGPEGPCDIEAFVGGETTKNDTARYTCRKFDRATYVGHCLKGKLDGVSLVIADGTEKFAKQAFVSYFDKGRIAYPALSSFLVGNNNLGMQQQGMGFGCVYFGKWDMSKQRCGLFAEVYGEDIFTETNAQKLRDGTFDLDHYRAKFLAFMERRNR